MKVRDRPPYSSADVVRLAGVSFRQLDYWTRAGFVTASLTPVVGRWRTGPGSGNPRAYSSEDVRRGQTIAQLLRHGLALHEASATADAEKLRRLAADLVRIAERIEMERVSASA